MKEKLFFQGLHEIFESLKDSKNFKELEALLESSKKFITNHIVSPSQFEMREKIGYGSKSIVYKGKYKFLDVAVKKISLAQTFPKQIKHILTEI